MAPADLVSEASQLSKWSRTEFSTSRWASSRGKAVLGLANEFGLADESTTPARSRRSSGRRG